MSSPKFDAEVSARGSGRYNLTLAGLVEMPPCPYPDHRSTDWALDELHPVTCGVCHPRAAELLEQREERAAA